MQEIHDGPKPSSSPVNESMPLDVMFQIWHTRNYNYIPGGVIRLSVDANASVAEASRLACQKCIGDVPEEIYVKLRKDTWLADFITIGDKNEKIKKVFQEGETLVVSDVPNYLQKMWYPAILFGVTLFCFLASLLVVLMYVISRYSKHQDIQGNERHLVQ